VKGGLGLWIAIGMGWFKSKDGSLINNVNFRPEQGLYFLTNVFMALTMSKHHEIWREARRLQNERLSF